MSTPVDGPAAVSGSSVVVDDLEDLFENAPCGYLSTDPRGRINRANRTLAAWLGHEQGALTGKRFQDVLNIAGKIYYETHFAPLLRMQGFFNEVALDLVAADGKTFPVLVNAVERRTDEGELEFIRITVFNASDRRRYEQELLEARRIADSANLELSRLNDELAVRVDEAIAERMAAEAALRQAQKMEAIGQLTGGVAHDFNNLLTVILGGLETISRHVSELPDSPQGARILRAATMASKGAQQATTLTARLLAFARRQPLDPKPVDPSRLVLGVADLLQRTLGETIALETVSGAGLWLTHVDPGELENSLVNLAVNARDAMPDGGKLTIETSNASLDEAYVAALAEPVAPGQYVLVAVTDTGCGMDSQTLDRIFEPFFTTKDVGKGTGLGLSQVYGFVRQTGGHIRVYSEPGEGTTVKLYLPRHEGVLGPDERPAQDIAETPRGDETILVVEDHEALRKYSGGVLRDLGYHVIEAATAQEAIAVVENTAGLDLLFTDVVLPGGLDGRRLAEEVEKRKPGVKVLYTTGYTRNAIVHNGRLDPGVRLIGKPFTAAALGAKVREVLDA